MAFSLLGLGMPFSAGGSESPTKSGSQTQKKMNPSDGKILAYCGIFCSECPAYIATQKNDDQMRAATAKKWSEEFKSDIKPQDINCDGCPSDSKRLFNYCNTCEIRKCAREKKVKNCAYCKDYPCKKLTDFLATVPTAKATLEEIRKNL